MPVALLITGPCEICGGPAHGRHFDVLSCRACAAFFRRSVARRLKAAEVVCINQNCKTSDISRNKCKTCRLKKCYEKGMNVDKMQSDRDLISSTYQFRKREKQLKSHRSSPQSLANFLGRPEFILSCEPDKRCQITTIIDLTSLIEKAKKILGQDFPLPSPNHISNSLDKLAYTMEHMRLANSHRKITMLKCFGKPETLFFWERAILETAQWFTAFSEFMEIDLDVKIDILKCAWILWIRLKKFADTAEQQKKKILNDDVIMCTDNICLNVQNFEMDIKWFSNYSMEQLRFYISPEIDVNWKTSVDNLIQLNPTSVELSFMLVQLCLNNAGKKYQGKVLEATEKLLQIQANNLHDYYTKTMNLTHYSGRLAKMMKVIHDLECDVRTIKERNHIARIFNIFTVDFSHPEMFDLA